MYCVAQIFLFDVKIAFVMYGASEFHICRPFRIGVEQPFEFAQIDSYNVRARVFVHETLVVVHLFVRDFGA